MRTIYQAHVEAFGRDSQLDMVVEECAELIKAIMKLRREEKDYCPLYEESKNELQMAQESVIEEATDVDIMLEQLKFMVPGDYSRSHNFKMKGMAARLKRHGVTDYA